MSGEKFLPIHEPVLGGREEDYLRECIETNWVSSGGPFIGRFEKAVCALTGSEHAVATSTGTAALHVALKIVGVVPGDVVIVPDLCFIAPVNAVRYCGATPVLIGSDAKTWHMDPESLEAFLAEECEMREGCCFDRKSGARVRAVMPVHLLGLACEIDRIAEIARRYDVRLVEDCAEAIGVRYKGRHVGCFSDAAALSFNGNKTITAGGGGMVLVADTERAARCKYLTTQAKDDPIEYIHSEVGFNYRLTNVHAAIGLAQIERIDSIIEKKRRLAARYRDGLASLSGLVPMPVLDGVEPTYWLYTALLPEGTTAERRRRVIRRLAERRVGARPIWAPMHSLPVNRDIRCYRPGATADIQARAVSLPSSASLTDSDVDRCIAALREALKS